MKKTQPTLELEAATLTGATLDRLESMTEETERLRALSSLLDSLLRETRVDDAESLAYAATAIHAAAEAAHGAALRLTAQAAFLETMAVVRRASDED